jgi:hypothetical protein
VLYYYFKCSPPSPCALAVFQRKTWVHNTTSISDGLSPACARTNSFFGAWLPFKVWTRYENDLQCTFFNINTFSCFSEHLGRRQFSCDVKIKTGLKCSYILDKTECCLWYSLTYVLLVSYTLKSLLALLKQDIMYMLFLFSSPVFFVAVLKIYVG